MDLWKYFFKKFKNVTANKIQVIFSNFHCAPRCFEFGRVEQLNFQKLVSIIKINIKHYNLRLFIYFRQIFSRKTCENLILQSTLNLSYFSCRTSKKSV